MFLLVCAWGAPGANERGATTLSARITGRVVDSQGLPVTGALITLRNALTGATETARSDGEGLFAFPAGAGNYRITAALEGFAEVTASMLFDGLSSGTVELRLAPSALRTEIVISASRLPELRDESPVKIETASLEQMKNSGHERVSQALEEIPGVVIRNASRASATVAGEQVQGIDSRQVLILLDGFPLVGARGVKSGALNLGRQPVGRLERVEVVKGAASALYGSDAIGGVINLITREPIAPVEADLSFAGDSLGSWDGHGAFGTRRGKASVFMDIERHALDGYGLLPNSPATVAPDARQNDLLFKARYALNKRVNASVLANAYHNRETGRSIAETGLTSGTMNDSSQNYGAAVDAWLGGSTTLQARAYTARYDENSKVESLTRNLPPSLANLNERYYRFDSTLSQQLGARQFAQLGTEWTRDEYRGVNRLVGDNAGQSVGTQDVWLQDRFQVLPRITVNAGARYHRHELFGSYVVPKAGIVARLSDSWSLRGSFGNGFRAPDLGQLYYRFANPANFYQVLGNPRLRPETSRSISAGAVYRRSRFRAGLNLYRNDVSNLIDSRLIGTPRNPVELEALLARYSIPSSFQALVNRQTYLYLNASRVFTRGFEIDGELAPIRGVRLAGAYTFLDARDHLSGLRLPQRHRHHGFAKAEYANARHGMYVNVRATFFSSWPLNAVTGSRAYPYRIVDLYASKELRRGVHLFAAVENVANSIDGKLRERIPTFDRPDPGRVIRMGVRYGFGGSGR